jgi:hypothetical protein
VRVLCKIVLGLAQHDAQEGRPTYTFTLKMNPCYSSLGPLWLCHVCTVLIRSPESGVPLDRSRLPQEDMCGSRRIHSIVTQLESIVMSHGMLQTTAALDRSRLAL